jgi:hypothetical protein
MTNKYVVVSGAVFGAVAAAHAVRALFQWPVQIAGLDIPTWISWVAIVVSGSLCAWAFRSERK